MNNTSIVNPPAIVTEILAAHKSAHTAARAALEYARIAGLKLIEAKAAVVHGEWRQWHADHLPMISARTIQNYMKVATHWPEIAKAQRVADLPLRDALKLLAAPKTKAATESITNADVTENTTALLKLRGDVAGSRRAEHRASRIVGHVVGQATGLCDDVTDDTGQINTELLAATEPMLRAVWARELRQAAQQITRLARALDRCAR